MTRTAAILLLVLLLFNWVGYRLYTTIQDLRVNSQLEASLDNEDYDASSLLSIKVPASHLPYYTNSKTFDRVVGQIEIDGIRYNYVKSRIYNDSLELLCIPNREAMNLQSAKDNFFKLVNDLQHNGQSKKAANHDNAKGFSPDYCSIIPEFQLTPLINKSRSHSRYLDILLLNNYYPVTEQPPDMLS